MPNSTQQQNQPPDAYSNHIRFLTLLRYLVYHTNPQNPATREDITGYLQDNHGVYMDARMISRYVEELNTAGFEIVKLEREIGFNETRYYSARTHSPSTPVILALLVEMADFLSREASDGLIREAMSFAPREIEEKMRKACFFSNLAKTDNQEICDNLYKLIEAITNNRCISFQVYDPNPDRSRTYHYNGERYFAEPISIIPDESNLYLWCKRTMKGETGERKFRIDYMANIVIEENKVSQECVDLRGKSSSKYTGIFKMFDGPKTPVTLEFTNECLRSIYKQFGYDIKPEVISGEGKYAIVRVTVDVVVSRYFYSWVMEGIPKMKIIGPEWVVEEFREYGEKKFENFHKMMQSVAATTDCETTGEKEPNEEPVSNDMKGE